MDSEKQKSLPQHKASQNKWEVAGVHSIFNVQACNYIKGRKFNYLTDCFLGADKMKHSLE